MSSAMKKIVVIGSGGAGKSTFSKQLGVALDIDVIHLDSLYWQPGWVKMPKGEWNETVRRLTEGESWIMDGNFGGTREMRMRASDTVIFLDIPRRVCLYRVLKRVVVYNGRTRHDMAEGCNERLDLEFIAWVWNYPNRGRRNFFKEIEQFRDKNIVILRSVREISRFIQTVKL
ncbi:DNA topology modulation protein [soil metagenome]